MEVLVRINRVMDLAEAQRIGKTPYAYRPGLWERALSILKRWAAEPCLKVDYDRRLELCRRVFWALKTLLERMERRAQWQEKHLKAGRRPKSVLNGKAGNGSAMKNGKNGSATTPKTVSSSVAKRSMARKALRSAAMAEVNKKLGRNSAGSRKSRHH